MKKKNIVVLGGGTGSFVILKGLTRYPVHLTAIVSMSDSGGSNKRIRDEFGLLPTSDIRSCLVALAAEDGESELMRKLFMYRFEKGEGISGMTFGNLFMAALSDILGSQKDAIAKTGQILRINGTVVPVTYTNTHLFAEYENGLILNEEHFIDEPKHDGTLKINKLYLEPNGVANPDALQAIKEADYILIGPGDLYTSILPNVLVQGIAEAIKNSSAKKIYTLNLMTKYGQTYGFSAQDHLRVLEKYLLHAPIDYVIVNDGLLPAEVLKLYEEQNEFPVKNDLEDSENLKVIREDFLGSEQRTQSKSDALKRSLIRHNPEKLARAIMKIVEPSSNQVVGE